MPEEHFRPTAAQKRAVFEDEIWYRIRIDNHLRSLRAWVVWLGVFAILQAISAFVYVLWLIDSSQT